MELAWARKRQTRFGGQRWSDHRRWFTWKHSESDLLCKKPRKGFGLRQKKDRSLRTRYLRGRDGDGPEVSVGDSADSGLGSRRMEGRKRGFLEAGPNLQCPQCLRAFRMRHAKPHGNNRTNPHIFRKHNESCKPLHQMFPVELARSRRRNKQTSSHGVFNSTPQVAKPQMTLKPQIAKKRSAAEWLCSCRWTRPCFA